MKKKLVLLGSLLLVSSVSLTNPRITSADYYWPNDIASCDSAFTSGAHNCADARATAYVECALTWDPSTYPGEYADCISHADADYNSCLDGQDTQYQGCLSLVDERPADYDHCDMARSAAAMCDADIGGPDSEFISQWVECRLASGVDQCQ